MSRSLAAFAASLTAAAVVTVAAPVASATVAQAASCATADPRSELAADCRSRGWTIRAQVVVNPQRVLVRSTLPACVAEDGGPVLPCSWNFPGVDTGDNTGRAYYVTGPAADPVAHYVTVRGAK